MDIINPLFHSRVIEVGTGRLINAFFAKAITGSCMAKLYFFI